MTTKKEISLCKQVAEKHRKEIKYGDWYLDGTEVYSFCLACVHSSIRDKFQKTATYLWTISDCLEFLWKEKKRDIISLTTDFPATAKRVWRIVTVTEECWGDTPLEACLKAVLAVLEEE